MDPLKLLARYWIRASFLLGGVFTVVAIWPDVKAMDPLKLSGFCILVGLVAVLGAMLRLITDRGRYVGRCKTPDECAAKHEELMYYRKVRNAEKPDEPYDGLDVADSA